MHYSNTGFPCRSHWPRSSTEKVFKIDHSFLAGRVRRGGVGLPTRIDRCTASRRAVGGPRIPDPGPYPPRPSLIGPRPRPPRDGTAPGLERGRLIRAVEGYQSRDAAADYERCLQLAGIDLRDDELFATLAALAGYYATR